MPQDLRIYGTGQAGWAAATKTGSKSLVVWESSDLRTWSQEKLIKVSPDHAGMTWAPDAIYDRAHDIYVVYWTSALNTGGWHTMRSNTKDFKSFSPAQIWKGVAGMDSTIVFDIEMKTYYRFSKNGPGELIEQVESKSLDGPWRLVKNQIGLGAMPKGEGPLIFQSNSNQKKASNFADTICDCDPC